MNYKNKLRRMNVNNALIITCTALLIRSVLIFSVKTEIKLFTMHEQLFSAPCCLDTHLNIAIYLIW